MGCNSHHPVSLTKWTMPRHWKCKGQVEFYKYSKIKNAWRVDDSPPICGDCKHGAGESMSLYAYNNTLVLAVASTYSVINYAGSSSACEYND